MFAKLIRYHITGNCILSAIKSKPKEKQMKLYIGIVIIVKSYKRI